MKIYQIATLAVLALTLAAGSAMARPVVGFPQTPSQIIHDLRNPNDMSYAPANKGG